MKHDHIEFILTVLAQGGISVEDAARKLRLAPYQELLEGLNIDQQRQQRTGLGETVLAEGKSFERLLAAIKGLGQQSAPISGHVQPVDTGNPVLATRVSQEQGEKLLTALKDSGNIAEFWPEARLFSYNKSLKLSPPWPRTFNESINKIPDTQSKESAESVQQQTDGSISANTHTSGDQSRGGRVIIVTAGAADLPVALEALGTARFYGLDPVLAPDLGVAGLHRLQPWLETLHQAELVIAVAGMDGALPSVLAGLCRCPVLGVPTSVGYGVAAGGYSALLNMLSGCAPGLAVLNVDNGYGAAMFAAKLLNGGR